MSRLVALLLSLFGVAFAQGLSLNGEVGLESGTRVTSVGGETAVTVPVVVRARLELDGAFGPDASFRTVLLPAFGSGPRRDEPLASLGLQEMYVELGTGNIDLSVGFKRLPLTALRLVEPVSLEPRLDTGEHRGPLTAGALVYSGAWRVRTALTGVSADDLIPDGLGGVASLRYESAAVTVEGHGFWTVRPAVGISGSGSAGTIVIYGEAWLLADPWEGRGGVGATGYLGEWLWTTELAWSPVDGDLRSAPAPVLAGSISRPLGYGGSLDATFVAAWPASPLHPQRRYPQLDAAVSLRQDRSDSSLTVTPALHLSEGVVAVSLGLSLRTYY